MTMETIDHPTLIRLVEAKAINEVRVMGNKQGWILIVKYGLIERLLAAQRSKQVRIFKRMDTLVTYLRDIGINEFYVASINHNMEEMACLSRSE